MTLKPLALGLLALFLLSIVAIPLQSFALSPVTFTTTDTATSQNQQFRHVYENSTSSIIALDTDNAGTYYSEEYDIVRLTNSLKAIISIQ